MKKALLVLTLGAFVASAGTALAGTTFTGGTAGVNHPIKVARETFDSTVTFQVPGPTVGNISRTLSVVPVTGTIYFLDLNIGAGITPADAAQSGVTWASVGGAATVTTTGGNCSLTSATLAAGGTTIHQRWSVVFSGCTSSPTLTFEGGAPNDDIIDGRAAGANLGAGVSIKEQVRFLDAFSQLEFPADAGSTTVDYVVSGYATSATLTPTTAWIDLSTQAKLFVASYDDTTLTDGGAFINFINDTSYYDWGGSRGAMFWPNGDTKGFYNVTFTSSNRNFLGVTSVVIDGHTASGSIPLTTRNWSFSSPGSHGSLDSMSNQYIVSTIDGTTAQVAGSFQVSVDYYTGTCAGASGTTCTSGATLTHAGIISSQTYTTWNLNGTVLYAPFASGNTTAFMVRFYVCAPLSQETTTSYDVEIHTVPVIGSTSTTLWTGTVLESLNAGGCMNIKMEDLLTLAGVPMPYTTDGGNLAVKLSFASQGVIGVHQTTNNPTLGVPSSFVTAPMVRLNKTVASPFGPLLIEPGL